MNQALADRLWPNRDPVGEGINVNGKPDEVIGVAVYSDLPVREAPAAPFVFRAVGPRHGTLRGREREQTRVPGLFIGVAPADPLTFLAATLFRTAANVTMRGGWRSTSWSWPSVGPRNPEVGPPKLSDAVGCRMPAVWLTIYQSGSMF